MFFSRTAGAFEESQRTAGRHLRSAMNSDRFRGDNVKYVYELLQTENGPEVPEGELFGIYFVNQVIIKMFQDACKEERGRWQWPSSGS